MVKRVKNFNQFLELSVALQKYIIYINIVYHFHFSRPPLYSFHSTAEARQEINFSCATLNSNQNFLPTNVFFLLPPVKLCLSIFTLKKKEQHKHRINIKVTYTFGHNFICADWMRNYFMYENKRRHNEVNTPNFLSPVVIEL